MLTPPTEVPFSPQLPNRRRRVATISTSSLGSSYCNPNNIMSGLRDQREAIVFALNGLERQPLADASRHLFSTLGYQSDRHLSIATSKQFRDQLDPYGRLTSREGEALDQVKILHLLFQLTDAELALHGDMFDDATTVNTTKIDSYLFFAAELPPRPYTRTELSTLVRAINKPLPMPALILFRHGDTVSLGIIHRRLHKRDQTRDVLEKVTLIKDIAFSDPIRAHVEILNDFVLDNLDADFGVSNFVRLHEAWQKRLARICSLERFLPRNRRLVFLGTAPGRGWCYPFAARLRHRTGKIALPDLSPSLV